MPRRRRRAARPVSCAVTSREQVDGLRVLESETLEDAPDDRAGIGRLGLVRARAEAAHARRHVARLRERRVVRLDQRTQGRRRLGQRNQLVEGTVVTLRGPCAPALVQKPEPGDVAQQSERPGDTALVREIGVEGGVVDERLVELDADERPRADAEVHGVGTAERDAATADPVSWVRDRNDTWRRPARSALGGAGPSGVPGGTTSGSSAGGISSRSSEIGRPAAGTRDRTAGSSSRS